MTLVSVAPSAEATSVVDTVVEVLVVAIVDIAVARSLLVEMETGTEIETVVQVVAPAAREVGS